jgi:hypothetical protein
MGVEAQSAAPVLIPLQRRQGNVFGTPRKLLECSLICSIGVGQDLGPASLRRRTPPVGRPGRRGVLRGEAPSGPMAKFSSQSLPRFCLFTISSARSMLSACTATLKRAAPLIAWTDIFSISRPPYNLRSALDQFAAITTNLKAAGNCIKARRECRDQPRPTVGLLWMCEFPLFAAALASPSPRSSCFAQRRTDLMQVLEDLPVGLKRASLMVGDGVLSTEVSDDLLCFSQLVPG